MTARLFAFALALIGLASLRAQFDVMLAIDSLWPRLWRMAAFFTVLTNVLLTAHLLAITKAWAISASRAAGLLLSILVVGLIYHLLLAGLWAPQGLAWWADQGLHTAMPLGYLAWWLAFAPKGLQLRDLPSWLIWPVAYSAYALVRGSLTGFWPYPFLDADALGWSRVAINVIAMFGLFTALGYAILIVARRLQARPS